MIRTKSSLAWCNNRRTRPASAGGGAKTPCCSAFLISCRASSTLPAIVGDDVVDDAAVDGWSADSTEGRWLDLSIRGFGTA
jgi:hypothetical protein